ncbi:MAG: hypothetical protein IJD97_07125 [Clostridia bacterium]|nr:hypothetical protein [Clostridia bacterium]
MKKQIKVILSALILVIVFFMVKNIFFDKSPKEQIFKIVNNNVQTLISDIARQDFSNSMAVRGIENVTVLEQGIDFYYGGKGIAPSSQEYGFYYTEDDLPKAIWCGVKYCDESLLVEDGNGYSADFQHNYYYTEKIRDNFYYYEAHF